MRRDCRFQTLFPMASLKIILCYLLIKRYHQEKMRGQSLLILKLCGFRYNAVKFSSCQIISLITFNPLLTADMESSQATTVHFLCCFSIAKSCPTLCSPMDCSTSGFSVLHYLPEFAQTHVHWVGDAIQSSYPLVTPFSSCPQSFPASGSFPATWIFASDAQVLELQLQHQLMQWIFRVDFL